MSLKLYRYSVGSSPLSLPMSNSHETMVLWSDAPSDSFHACPLGMSVRLICPLCVRIRLSLSSL